MAAPATPDLRRQLPWLVLPRSCSSDDLLIFVDLISEESHDLQFTPPVGCKWRCCGSSHGWLVILDKSPNVVVLNPSTGVRLNLAPASTLPQVTGFNPSAGHRNDIYDLVFDQDFLSPPACDYEFMHDVVIRKIVLSDSPDRDPNFTALAIFNHTLDGSNLAFCKYGQDRWTLVPGAFVADAIFIQGTVRAVNSGGGILKCDLSSDPPSVVERVEITGSDGYLRYLVFVPNDDGFRLVTRSYDSVETTEFKVYELDFAERRWVIAPNLGGMALFVGRDSCSYAATSTDSLRCLPNSIYYTEDDGQQTFPQGIPDEYDIGIFCYETGVWYELPCTTRASPSSLTSPFWYIP